MSTIWQGYIFAVLSSIFSAVYVIPKKLSKQKPITYAMFMGAGFLIASVIGFAFYKIAYNIEESLLDPNLLLACAGGVVYAVASVCVLSSIDRIGLAKANQWKSLQGPIGTLMMLTVLSEFLTINLVFILLAVLFLLASAVLLTVKEEHNNLVDKKGIAYALVAAFFYGIFASIQKHLTNVGLLYSQHIYVALFIFLSTGLYIAFKHKNIKVLTHTSKKEMLLPLTGGVLYYVTSFFSILAFRHLEGSIVFMIHQLNTVWLFLFGVILFKEINFMKHRTRLIAGLVCSFIGVLMLVL